VTIKNIESASSIALSRKNSQGFTPGVRHRKEASVDGIRPRGARGSAQLNTQDTGHRFSSAPIEWRLLRYGIPRIQNEKRVVDRRLNIMTEEAVYVQNPMRMWA